MRLQLHADKDAAAPSGDVDSVTVLVSGKGGLCLRVVGPGGWKEPVRGFATAFVQEFRSVKRVQHQPCAKSCGLQRGYLTIIPVTTQVGANAPLNSPRFLPTLFLLPSLYIALASKPFSSSSPQYSIFLHLRIVQHISRAVRFKSFIKVFLC